MTQTSIFAELSRALAANAQRGAAMVAGVDWGGRHHISALLWQDGILVSSEQSLPDAEAYTALLPGGERRPATLAGRDPSTNVAVLRGEFTAPALPHAEPDGVGGMVQALGSDGAGGVSARIGCLEMLGPPWESLRGGRIDRLIRVATALHPAAEGGPVVNPEGGLLGMSTFGPRNNVLVIPGATIARVVGQLLQQGRIARGWLGAGLHPVALPKELGERVGAVCGLMVVNLAEGAPAASALIPGDILLAIGDVPVASARAVAAALGPETIGQRRTLRVLRGGTVTQPEVTITARPA